MRYNVITWHALLGAAFGSMFVYVIKSRVGGVDPDSTLYLRNEILPRSGHLCSLILGVMLGYPGMVVVSSLCGHTRWQRGLPAMAASILALSFCTALMTNLPLGLVGCCVGVGAYYSKVGVVIAMVALLPVFLKLVLAWLSGTSVLEIIIYMCGQVYQHKHRAILLGAAIGALKALSIPVLATMAPCWALIDRKLGRIMTKLDQKCLQPQSH